MKELRGGKETDSVEKGSGSASSAPLSEKMVQKNIEVKKEDVKVNEVSKDDGEDKIINTLSENIGSLNISPDSKEEDCSQEDGGPLSGRGPTGGIPCSTPSGYQNKHIPMGPIGNYVPPQGMTVQPSMKGNRRMLDESDEQPSKFIRPPVYQGNGWQGFQFGGNVPSFQNYSGMNDLSSGMSQQMPNEPFYNFCGQTNFGFPCSDSTKQLLNPTGMSGGAVTIQSPVSSSQMPLTFADEFLEAIDKQSSYAQSQTGNLPNLEDSFSGDSFREMRRPSDPVDSGIESEGGSPWSEQAPSPASPLSVESGYGRSPMHESQYPVGVSPHYPSSVSPASFRGTPSPAGSSGYGSPGQPYCEDFDSDLLEDAMAVITADLNTTEMKKRQKQQLAGVPTTLANQPMMNTVLPPQMQPPPKMSQPGVVGPPVRPAMVIPGAPVQGLQTQTITTTGIPVTTAPPQQIIILAPPQTTNQSMILVPLQTSPAPQKKGVTQYKKIAPKITTSPNTSTTGGTGITTMSRNGTAPITTRSGPAAGKNANQQNAQTAAQQNKLLMIARRTVADIPREDLRKSDDEGDTYLHIAVCKTDKHMVQALLERLHREKLVNLVDQENLKRQTPLYLAAFINQPVMVAMFIKFQANVNVLAQTLSSDGQTTEVKAAIHVAASQGVEYHRTLVELLKAKDISINIVNNYGQTALHCAILAHGKMKRNGQDRINSIEIIKTLIKAGADASAQDKKSGKTPLMYAIEQKSLVMVETILHAVDPDKVKNVVKTQAFDGSSCLKIAESLKGSLEVEIWNRLWNILQCAASGSLARFHYQSQPFHQQAVV